MNNKTHDQRRLLLKVMLASPLLAMGTHNAIASPFMDVDLEMAQIYWNAYRTSEINPKTGQAHFPRHRDRQAEQALFEIAEPIMATSTRQTIVWRCGLVENGQINAITPGGGVILVFDGLIRLCDTEAELAAIIAHEVGHVEHRHAIQRIYAEKVLEEYGINPKVSARQLKHFFEKQQYDIVASKIIYKSYKRLWEHQADAYIISAFKKLGYSMNYSYTFFEKMMREIGTGSPDICIYSTHPLMKERIARLKNLGKAYRKTAPKPASEAFRYLKKAVG